LAVENVENYNNDSNRFVETFVMVADVALKSYLMVKMAESSSSSQYLAAMQSTLQSIQSDLHYLAQKVADISAQLSALPSIIASAVDKDRLRRYLLDYDAKFRTGMEIFQDASKDLNTAVQQIESLRECLAEMQGAVNGMEAQIGRHTLPASRSVVPYIGIWASCYEFYRKLRNEFFDDRLISYWETEFYCQKTKTILSDFERGVEERKKAKERQATLIGSLPIANIVSHYYSPFETFTRTDVPVRPVSYGVALFTIIRNELYCNFRVIFLIHCRHQIGGGEFRDEVQHRDGSGIHLMRNRNWCCHARLQSPHRRGAGSDC
jgi:hypothetical protein